MRFSIITVTRNSEKFLADAVKSVLAQDYEDFEYLIIDGASTDCTLEMIKAFAAQDKRIHWQSEPDDGIADAFNKGIRLAAGEITGILNSDDTYAPGTLGAVAAYFAEHSDCDVVHGDMLRFQGETPLFTLKPVPVDERIWHDMPVNHPAVFVRRRAYEMVGLFDARLRFAMDYELMLRLYRAGCRFCYLERVLANMRYGGASDTGFMSARREVYSVTVAAGYPRWRAACWFLIKAAMNMIKNLLRTSGLHCLMRLHPKFRQYHGER